MSDTLQHEQVRVQRGPRSGLPIIVAVHSTALGQAIGGCRLTNYPRWTDGLTDALRLSAAMTDKCAIAGLPNGGGKAVAAIPATVTLGPEPRRALLHDIGDVIAGLGGAYATGPDVGTSPADMVTISERTAYAFCRPPEAGGSGDSSTHTAAGVMVSLHAVCREVFGSSEVRGRRFIVSGLGRVGSEVATRLAAEGAELIVSDVDPTKRSLAGSLRAVWMEPEEAMRAEAEVLVPAALGELFTRETVAQLRCAAIAGPANNQLDEPDTADLLHRRGIVWAPDFVVSAGGVIHATAVELHHETSEQAARRVAEIGVTLTTLLRTARQTGVTPAAAAIGLARERIDKRGT